MMRAACVLPLVVASLGSCSRGPGATGAPSASASLVASVEPAAGRDGGHPDAAEGRLFDEPADAFRAVLERRPLVIAVGEAHAQKSAADATSSAKWFTDTMLPELAGKASDLILELMLPPTGCEARTKAVNKQMRDVTAPQAETNQNEYVTLGDAAQRLAIEPHLLHPTCDDFKAITARDADATDASLVLIARLLRETAERALARNASRGVEKIVVVYGGAMHNDLQPMAGMADYAYGPAVAALAKGRYVELDIFVPELVRDSGLWPKLAWYKHFDRRAHPHRTTLFAGPATDAGASFTILLPASREAGAVSPP